MGLQLILHLQLEWHLCFTLSLKYIYIYLHKLAIREQSQLCRKIQHTLESCNIQRPQSFKYIAAVVGHLGIQALCKV